MNDELLRQSIETHETWLDYHLEGWATAKEKGSYAAAERSLADAAQHAAIVSALRSRAHPLKERQKQ